MSEVKRTREEAKRASNDKILELVWSNSYKCLFKNTSCFEVQGDNLKIYRFPFTPPKPEYEKDTFGKFFDDHGMYSYGKLDRLENGVYYSDCASSAPRFTPIIQNDPILERAFELACAIDITVENVEHDDYVKKSLLSQAKKELE